MLPFLTLAIPFILVGPDKMPTTWQQPGYNKLVWIQSPNCNLRPANAVVDTIVLHSTAQDTLKSTTLWFQTPTSQVSSHFTIGKDGSIIENVSTFNRAWHAGASRDILGRGNLNNFSIGIELVNMDNGVDPYPPAQIQALHNLVMVLKRRFPLKYMTSHAYIAVPHGRKVDPNGFPWHMLDDTGLELVP